MVEFYELFVYFESNLLSDESFANILSLMVAYLFILLVLSFMDRHFSLINLACYFFYESYLQHRILNYLTICKVV